MHVATTIYNNKLKFTRGEKYKIYSKGRVFYLSVGNTKLYYAENMVHKESSLPPSNWWVGENKDQLDLKLRFTYDL